MRFVDSQHPREEDLLKFADGELMPRERREVQEHLAACWQCRSEFEELEATVASLARYRKVIREGCFPSPPAPWRDIRNELDELDATLGSRSVLARVGEALRGPGFSWRWTRRTHISPMWILGSWRMAPVAAGAVLLLFAVLYRNEIVPRTDASQVLSEAVAAESAQPAGMRPVRIRTASWSAVRGAGAGWADARHADGERIQEMAGWFRKAGYDFNDPVSARAFAGWRNRLSARHDRVEVADDSYRIQTASENNDLEKAELRLTRKGLQPVAAAFDFRGQPHLDVENVPDVPTATLPSNPPLAGGTRMPQPGAPESGAGRPAVSAVRPATPDEEVEVFAALHRIGADLGEPIEVTRQASQIQVTGFGLSAARRSELSASLAGIQQVTLQFSEGAPVSAPPSRPSATVTPSAELTSLRTRIEKVIGGTGGFGQLADDILETSDSLMSRAYALRRLARRFPPEVEAQLSAPAQTALADMRREHAAALAAAARHIEQRMNPVLSSLGAAAAPAALAPGATWQATVESLFQDARRTETALAGMLGGAASDVPADQLPDRLASSLAELRSRADQYRAQASR